MKGHVKIKILLSILALFVFSLFTQCTGEMEQQTLEFGGGNLLNTQSQAVKNGFENTVHAVLTSNQYQCIGCHTAQSPRHAHPDVDIAMNEFLDAGLMNMQAPSASRIIDKVVIEKHNCAPKCDELAVKLNQMVIAWNEVIQNEGGLGDDDSSSEDPPEVCEPVIYPLTVIVGDADTGGTGLTRRQAFDQEVFPFMQNTSCAGCHSSGGPPRHSSSNANEAYQVWEDDALANFDNIPQSSILLEIASGHQGYSTNSPEYTQIASWIENWRNNIDPNAGENPDQVTYSREYNICDSFNGVIASENSIIDNQTTQTSGGSYTIAEANLIAPMMIQNDYIHNPNAHPLYPVTQQNVGKVKYNFNVYEAGDYEVVAEVWSESATTDSFYVAITPAGIEPLDNASDYTEWRFGNNNGQFIAEEVTDQAANGAKKVWSLAPGQYTLTFKERENFSRIRNVVVKQEGAENPAGDSSFTLMEFDLAQATGVTGAKVTFKLEDFDLSSYHISDVRITGGEYIYVKNLKILVNDQYYPGNATYTLVDKLVVPGDESISDSSMVMLKVNGMGDVQDTDPLTGELLFDENGDPVYKPADRLSIQFEVLAKTSAVDMGGELTL